MVSAGEVLTTMPTGKGLVHICTVAKRRVGVIAPVNRERRFPVCRCPEAEEGNHREPCPARHSKNLLAGSSSDRPPAPACGREYALASLTADPLHVESTHSLRFSTNWGIRG